MVSGSLWNSIRDGTAAKGRKSKIQPRGFDYFVAIERKQQKAASQQENPTK